MNVTNVASCDIHTYICIYHASGEMTMLQSNEITRHSRKIITAKILVLLFHQRTPNANIKTVFSQCFFFAFQVFSTLYFFPFEMRKIYGKDVCTG